MDSAQFGNHWRNSFTSTQCVFFSLSTKLGVVATGLTRVWLRPNLAHHLPTPVKLTHDSVTLWILHRLLLWLETDSRYRQRIDNVIRVYLYSALHCLIRLKPSEWLFLFD